MRTVAGGLCTLDPLLWLGRGVRVPGFSVARRRVSSGRSHYLYACGLIAIATAPVTAP